MRPRQRKVRMQAVWRSYDKAWLWWEPHARWLGTWQQHQQPPVIILQHVDSSAHTATVVMAQQLGVIE